MFWLLRALGPTLILLLFLVLAGCNTIEGAGEDMQEAGEAIEEGADWPSPSPTPLAHYPRAFRRVGDPPLDESDAVSRRAVDRPVPPLTDCLSRACSGVCTQPWHLPQTVGQGVAAASRKQRENIITL
ncbi:MAG: entericidin A/B family lipoprotein [Arhodomonas sp.]|nr:entericidin A/B family lipoprotein [Arhodomonas sp.]